MIFQIIFTILLNALVAQAAPLGPVHFDAEVRTVAKDSVTIGWFESEFKLPRTAVSAEKFTVPSVQQVTLDRDAYRALNRAAIKNAKLRRNSKSKPL